MIRQKKQKNRNGNRLSNKLYRYFSILFARNYKNSDGTKHNYTMVYGVWYAYLVTLNVDIWR